jgi:N,N'-diacetyllegionaminate synthase
MKKKKPYLVAEIGLAHDGSLGLAKSFVKKAFMNGADAVKFQHHNSLYESSSHEKFRKKFSDQDKTRKDYWNRTSFKLENWINLRNYCKKIGIDFICSPFSIESAQEVNKLDIDYWKIASGEFNNLLMLEYIVFKSKKPIILSTGLANEIEIKKITNFLKKNKKIFYLLKCTSKYPTPLEQVGHNEVDHMKKKYRCPVGVSDHSGNVNSLIAAIAFGASILEFHVTFDEYFFGPDNSSSILFKDLLLLSKFNRDFDIILNKKINLEEMRVLKKRTAKIFKKSIYAKENLKKNQKISIKDIIALKPERGLSVIDYKKLIGKKTKKTIKKGDLLKLIDLE